MSERRPTVRIGIYGPDVAAGQKNSCNLWPAGVAAAVTAAEGEPTFLPESSDRSWGEVLEGIHGVVVIGHDHNHRRSITDAEALVTWCHDHNIPMLGIDHGLLILNTAHGGTLHNDLPRDLPEALQHRHPPERGLRHAIAVVPQTHLAELYGDGEVEKRHARIVLEAGRYLIEDLDSPGGTYLNGRPVPRPAPLR